MPCNNTITKSPLEILETTQMATTQVYDYVNLATNVHFFHQNEIQKVGLMSPPLQDFISCMNIMDS